MEIIKDSIRNKINSKANLVDIDGELLITAVSCIIQWRLGRDDLNNYDEIESEILQHYLLEYMANAERLNYENMQSSLDINEVREAAMLNEHITKEEMDNLDVVNIVKELLNTIKTPKKIHANALVDALCNVQDLKINYNQSPIAEVAVKIVGEEIDMIYRSMGDQAQLN